MLYLAIPAHNEVATIGVLLWRIRTVLAEFPREYEVVVYDDASSDETAEVAEQYAHAMPVTVLRGASHVGYAGALDALIRHVSAQTRYPRRDAMMLVQGDFTDPPGIVPEFARRFEGGADLVVGERMVVADAPVPVRRLFKAAHWAMRPFVRVDGVNDLTASMRLIRISALRDLVRLAGSEPICVGDSWTANADLLLKLVPLARRVESVPMEPTYGVRMRDTRRVAVRDALAALKWAWGARGRRAVAGSAADAAGDAERRVARTGAPTGKRREETELSVEKLRERVRDRPRVEDEESFNGRREGRRRERERTKGDRPSDEPQDTSADPIIERSTVRAPERPAAKPVPATPVAATPVTDKPSADKRPPRVERPARPERLPRGERAASSETPKPPRRAREERRAPYSDSSIELADPFAAPAPTRDDRERALERALGPVDRDDQGRLDAQPAIEPAVEPASESESPYTAPRSSSPSIPQRRDDAQAEDGDEDRGEDDGELDDDAAGAETVEVEGAAPRKRRRRNRRSRRGRAKKDGATEGTDETAHDGDSDPTDDDVADAEAHATEALRMAGDNADDSSEDGANADLDSAARARRRGRRGRRGGARRSRGQREKEGNDGSDGGSRDTGGSASGEGGGES